MLLVCLVGARTSVAASQTSSYASTKQAQARRLTTQAPTVDGSLDDDVWKTAPWFSDFVQKEPVEGGEPPERTEVGFLYDDDALYVGARMWRSPTGELPHPVTRRDQFSNAEQLIISLDTYHDHRTGFTFCISSGGVRSDYYHPGDAEDYRDYGFDPVWEARVTLDSIGWSAEMRIPFSQLRFNSRQEQVWGLNINRWMPGSNQDIYWVMIPKQESGYFSRIGQLVGIEGIRPSRRLEVLPYVAADARYTSNTDPADPFNDGSDYLGRAGADVKMGLGPNLTLDGTVNPDFGQVDADPAVVNLTAYEIFFPERRPFFTEGNNLLRGNGPGYYYSRRIGAPPHGDPGGDFVNAPDNTTIIGAAKITGRTAKGLSVGSLFAVTANEYADTFDTLGTVKGHSRVEPLTSYGVARVQQEFGASASTVGVTLTGVERDLGKDILDSVLSRRAYSGGVDWNLRFQGGTYELSGYGGFSYVAGDSTRIADVQQASARYFQRPDATHVKFDPSRTSLTGYTAGLGFSKLGGKHWVYDLNASAESPEFELNDAGQLSAADDIDVDGSLRYREIQPGKLFHRYNVGVFGHVNWNYGGERQFTRFAVSSSQTWKGFQQTFLGAYLRPRYASDELTRGGPLMGSPMVWGTDLEFFSGEAGNFQWRVNGNLQGDEFDGNHLEIGAGVSFRPAPQWFLSLDPRYERSKEERQYLDTQPGGSAATFGQRYIFAALDQTTISAQLRLNYIITPNLSIEGYLEPFASSGAYTRLGELPEPQSTTLRRYGTDGTTIERFAPDSIVITDNGGADSLTLSDPDFNVLSFRSNLVLRWEWRPGSTLFLVWQQSRGSEVTSSHRVTIGDMWDSFGTEGDNFFALKITYWLGIG